MADRLLNEFETVDVIIPTYRPDEKLGKLLRGLVRQDYPISSIILVNTDNELWDDLEVPEYYERESGEKIRVVLKHISKEEFDHASTRHRAAMEMSDADYFVCMTQDAVPVNDAVISSMLKTFAQEDVAVCYARQLPAKDCDFLERRTRLFNYPKESRKKTKFDLEELGIKTFFCSDVCAMYRKETFVRLNGFVRTAIFNEDMLYAYKAVMKGYAVFYCAEAKVVHSHNYNGLQQFTRNFDMGVSQEMYRKIFDRYPSEGEGMRMVMTTAKDLLLNGCGIWIPKLIYMSGCKYLGYRLGRNFKKMPMWLIRRFSPGAAQYISKKKKAK